MECPKCKDQNQDGLDEICSACGEALNECPNCGYKNPLLAQKCTNCGEDLKVVVVQPKTPRKIGGKFWWITGLVFIVLFFAVPIAWKWEPYTEIVIATLAAFFLHVWQKGKKELPLREMLGWRMWYVYAMVVGLLIAIAAR